MPSPQEQRKFYLRTPDLEFTQGGPIKIGNIITDMFLPQDSIAIFEPLPKVMKGASAAEGTQQRKSHAANKLDLSLKLYEAFGGHAEAKNDRHLRTVYDYDEIESSYLETNPTAKDVKAFRKKDEEVDGALADRPVYIVTGLKIAKGLKYANERTTESQAGASAGAHVNENAAISGEVGRATDTENSESYKIIGDCIIAYRLHIVKPGGWTWRGQQKPSVGTYDPGKAGFMNRGEQAKEAELESEEVSQQDVTCFAEEQRYGDIKKVEFDDAEESWSVFGVDG
jgi:hypothetical protein